MKKITSICISFILVLSVFLIKNTNLYAATNVSDVATLKAAITANEDIVISNDFVISEEIIIPNTYNKTISSNNHTLTLGNGISSMFKISGTQTTFSNIIFDANQQGRIFNVSNSDLRILNSTLKNGNGFKRGGLIEAYGDTTDIIIESSNLLNSKVQYSINSRRGDGSPGETESFGGAVYAAGINSFTIRGSEIRNNFTTDPTGEKESGQIFKSMGGSIHLDNVKNVVSSQNKFSGNHSARTEQGASEGGSVYLHNIEVYRGEENTYETAAVFNTGGSLMLRDIKDAIENNSDFNIGELGDFGVSGGSITTETSNLTITNSRFKAIGTNTKVTHSGGFISVVGGGNFVLKDSTMTGPGSWWGGPRISTFGGAIAFETGSTATALIENTKIENIASEHTGGAITLSTKLGERSAVNLTLRNTDIINTRAYFWNHANGGAIYNGPGNKVVIEGGNLRDNFSKHGGAIRNDGEMIISGGATILNSSAYDIGGGIYNDGYLKLDNMSLNANMVGSARHDANRYPNYSYELGGTNIYAAKDVIITPNATISANKDVRVIDGKSSILLTGELTNPIYVSVSEESKAGTLEENVIRKVGYVVAKGTEGYTPTKSDAVKLHYTSKVADTYPELHRQSISDIDDTTSVGKWDFVLNPETNNVVLGQRAKLVYNVNEANAKFADNTTTKEQLYELYSSSTPWTTTRQMTDLGENPTLEGTKFVGWHTDNASGKPYLTPADVTNNGYNPVE